MIAEEIEKLPVMSRIHDKGYEVLYFLDERDEFVTQIMREYEGKNFKNVTTSDLDLDSAEEKKEKEEKTEANKDMLEAMKDALNGNVKEVRISSRLKDDPVCIVADEGLSLDMERYMANDPMSKGTGMKAVKILEINPDHPVFAKLQSVYASHPDRLADYADVLYNQALLIQGLPIDDPVAYARKITDLMISAE